MSDNKFWAEFNTAQQLVDLSKAVSDKVMDAFDDKYVDHATLMQGKAIVNLFVVVEGGRADMLIDMKDTEVAKVEIFQKVISWAKQEIATKLADGTLSLEQLAKVLD